MLSIKTDLENTSWLTYLMEEFKRIQGAQFDINIIPLDGIQGENNLMYAYNTTEGVSVYCSREQYPSGDIEYIDDRLFVLGNTRTKEGEYTCNYDLFWNAFVFLSRKEEYELERAGALIRGYSSNHPRTDKSSFDIPIVTHLFQELEQLITKEFPNLKFEEGKQPYIELSHDLDYINKTIQLRGKQTVFNAYNAIKSIFKPAQFFKHLAKSLSFMFSSPSYWCFDYWADIEKSHNRKSVYYVYANTGKKNFKSWLIDPSYDVATNVKLQDKLKELLADGCEIGLHGSYFSATNPDLLKEEKEMLEKAIGTSVTRTRQHWLNYQESITPHAHSELFELDSTLAWNDRMGYRAGCVSKFRPYDHETERAFSYFEIPQVIMDSNIYDYGSQKLEEQKKLSRKLLENLKNYKNAYVSISWHQRVCSSDYKWHETYEDLIKI